MFVELLKLIQNGKITDRGGEMTLREIIFKPEEFDNLIKNYSKIEIEDIGNIVDLILKENENAAKEFKKEEERALDFLVGQVIKKTGKRVDAKKVIEVIKSKISA